MSGRRPRVTVCNRRYIYKMMLLSVGCTSRPDLVVGSVQDLGPLETSEAIRGRDGGYSVAFQGRSVWLYGDTLLSLTGEDGLAWRDNSWSHTADLDASDGLTGFDEPTDALGAPEEFFPETPSEAAYNQAHRQVACIEPCGGREVLWPMDAVFDEERDRVLAFYVKIHGEPGAWNFFPRGYGVALWSDLDALPERPVLHENGSTLLFTEEAPSFGQAALIDGGWLYAYACPEDGWSKPCVVGRVDPAEVLDREVWRFWDGEGWSAEVSEAAPIFEGASQLTVDWVPALDRFLAVYADGLEGDVALRTAPAPEGPWSDPKVAFTAEAAYGDGWVYCGLAHDELARHDGATQVISYYRPTGDWTGEIRLVEVGLEAR